ncbi:MAG TPA: TIR domain-containing protein [Pyrinomonadaceae bacterium]|nr:TIR domain-containing protein [Pyrinomonadaceae bacterium]
MTVNLWLVVTLAGLLAAAVLVVWLVNRRKGATPTPIADGRRIDENVQFTVYRPQAVEPSKWYPLLAFAHLSERPEDAPPDEPEPFEQVRAQAQARLGKDFEDFRQVTPDTLHAVPRESDLTFVPEFEGIEFRPAQQSLLWLGEVRPSEFQMRAGPELEGRAVKGRVAVYLGAKLTADIELSIRVDTARARELAKAPPAAASASPYRKVFVSYSRRDAQVVEHFVAIARASGDEYLKDVTHLRAGEVWSKRLEQMIEEANVFQLFWSSHSMRSDFVRKEWEYALALNRPNFIRPTFWEEPLPADEGAGLPPEALAALNFYRLPVRLDETVRSRLLQQTAGTPHVITRLQRGKTIVSALVVAVLVARVAVFKPPTLTDEPLFPVTPTPTASPTPGVSPTPELSPSPTPGATTSPTPVVSPTPTLSPTPSPTTTNNNSNARLYTPTPTAAPTPRPTQTSTPVPTPPLAGQPLVALSDGISTRRVVSDPTKRVRGTHVINIPLVNAGGGPARNFVVTVTLPEGARFVHFAPPNDRPRGKLTVSENRGEFAWQAGDLGGSEKVLMSVVISARATSSPAPQVKVTYQDAAGTTFSKNFSP